MLRLALLKAKELDLVKVLITCYDDNTASAKVIENNGGVFERYAEKENKKLRRYWIII
jgi:predicted acetyltransferase